jgi:hypothetical protein
VGDTVLVKNQKKGKLIPPFNPDPYEVTAVKGSMITASRGDHSVTRNSSFFKSIFIPSPDHDTIADQTRCMDEIEEELDSEERGQETNISRNDTPQRTPNIPTVRRSNRAKTTPRYLKDYALSSLYECCDEHLVLLLN